jgi:photosystem II stability/assembly factor-like uncharacterized protein
MGDHVAIKTLRLISKALFVIGWVGLSLWVLSLAPAPRTEAEREELSAEIKDYFEWLMEGRVERGKVLGSLLTAWDEVNKMPISNSDAVWEPLGPAPLLGGTNRYSGRTNSIAIDPTDPNTVYIGSALGGVWKSTNGGGAWTPLTDDQPSMAMGSVAIDPSNRNIIYAGTGEQNFSGDSYYGAGVLRSTDGGQNWTRLGQSEFVLASGGGARISRIVIDRASPNIIYAATTFGLFKSTNRGDTWSLKLSGRSTPEQTLAAVTDLVIDPSNTRVLYAGLAVPASSVNKGVYKSTDAGEQWTRLDIGLDDRNIGRINFGLAPSNPQTLYAVVQNAVSSPNPQIFRLKTTDGGNNWTQLPGCAGGGCGQGSYNLVLAVHPQNPDIVYQGAVSLFRSVNGGASWSAVPGGGGHSDYHWLIFDQLGNLYIGNDGGVFRRSPSDMLSSLNTNLAITQYYPGAALHPVDPSIVQAGAQDNGSSRTSGDLAWRIVCGADGGYQAIEGADGDPDNVWYCSSQRLGIRKTINNGQSTFGAVSGITPRTSATTAFIAPFILDPNNSGVLIAGTNQVWRTEDGAASWVVNSDQLTTGTIRRLAFAPMDSGTTYYAGTNTGFIWRTTDTGQSWKRVSEGLPVNQGRIVSSIAVHPFDSSIVYATVSGFGKGHVFRSLDYGDNWEDISGDLPNLPTNALLVDAYTSDPPILYLGTDLGVFRSLNDGKNWDRYSAGLPNTRVEDLVYNSDTGTLVAVTHGRGVWLLSTKGARRKARGEK